MSANQAQRAGIDAIFLPRAARKAAHKIVPIYPHAFRELDRFFLTTPLGKREIVSLAVMELLERKLSNSELSRLWEKHRTSNIKAA